MTCAWYAAAANIPACCSGLCNTALCHQHTRAVSTTSSLSLMSSSFIRPMNPLATSRVSSAAAVESFSSSTKTTL